MGVAMGNWEKWNETVSILFPLVLLLNWTMIFMYWAIDHTVQATIVLALVTLAYFGITNEKFRGYLLYGFGILLGFLLGMAIMILIQYLRGWW